MPEQKQKILGILDLTKYPRLGDLLFFIENIKIKQYDEKAKIDIAIITQDKAKLFSFLPVIYNYLDVDNCILLNSDNEEIRKGYDVIIPNKNKENPFDTTLPLQKFFFEKKFIPVLSSKLKLREECKKFLEEQGKEKLKIIVHLKNVPNEEGNANLEEWYKFFKYCEENVKNIVFILIGNDILNEDIENLPNVVITKDKKLGIVKELALIELADIFMGSCSGPFQIALFSKVPYVVFKDPEHHKDKMSLELGNSNRFLFATPNQLIFRENETYEKILENFNKIYEKIKEKGKMQKNRRLF